MLTACLVTGPLLSAPPSSPLTTKWSTQRHIEGCCLALLAKEPDQSRRPWTMFRKMKGMTLSRHQGDRGRCLLQRRKMLQLLRLWKSIRKMLKLDPQGETADSSLLHTQIHPQRMSHLCRRTHKCRGTFLPTNPSPLDRAPTPLVLRVPLAHNPTSHPAAARPFQQTHHTSIPTHRRHPPRPPFPPRAPPLPLQTPCLQP